MKNAHQYIVQKSIETPIGTMVCCAYNGSICLLEFSDYKNLDKELKDISLHLDTEIRNGTNEIILQLETQLCEYFLGKRKGFSIPLQMVGTDFQKTVWKSLLKIPYGKTTTYSTQALSLDNLKAIRAVASANGANKIAILIPCHRVIGSNGNLTGYAGGIWRKQKLLELENAILF